MGACCSNKKYHPQNSLLHTLRTNKIRMDAFRIVLQTFSLSPPLPVATQTLTIARYFFFFLSLFFAYYLTGIGCSSETHKIAMSSYIFFPPLPFPPLSSYVLSSGWLASWVSRRCPHQQLFLFFFFDQVTSNQRLSCSSSKFLFIFFRHFFFVAFCMSLCEAMHSLLFFFCLFLRTSVCTLTTK